MNVCALEGCDEAARRKYCSDTHANLARQRRKRRRDAEGPGERVCTAPGCTWVLCRYNPTDRCTLHGGWVLEVPDTQDAEQQRADDLLELMGAA